MPGKLTLEPISSYLMLHVNGQIESGKFVFLPDTYCKYSLVYGSDWRLLSESEEGMSQVGKLNSSRADSSGEITFNLPLDFTLKATSPHGWPQLVISCYGRDVFGNDVVRGYGAVHLPFSPGTHTKRIPMFVPESSSLIQKFFGWIAGSRPEFVNFRQAALHEGREVTRVKSQGYITVSFNVITKNLLQLGYETRRRYIRQESSGETFETTNPAKDVTKRKSDLILPQITTTDYD